jgi:tRNA G18 (ribose-2'-O)-methylase SpoU
VTPVTSLDDPRIADYQLVTDPAALLRAGLFVAEGRLVVRRLLESPRFRTQSVLVSPTAYMALADVLERVEPQCGIYVVEQALMSAVAGFHVHRGCLALAVRPPVTRYGESPIPAQARRLLVLEGVNNPDNVGGVFRSAAAFGVEIVVLGPGCGDPWYRKAIRTSMAATLQVPFVDATAEWPRALVALRAAGVRLVALTPAAGAGTIDRLPRGLPRVAVLVGTEGAGLSMEALAAADDRVRIPMRDGVDSLNLTVAASIAMYHMK